MPTGAVPIRTLIGPWALLQTDHWEVSDGKTLTNTVTYPGVDKQEVDVYERQ